jgi:hypothetical protein
VSFSPLAPTAAGAVVLSGGGSSATVTDGAEPVRMTDRVLSRIARADGWIVRSSAPPTLIGGDRDAVVARRTRLGESAPFAIVRATFVHVSLAPDTETALHEQVRAMSALGWTGTTDELRAAYPTGTCDEIVQRLRSELGGVAHVILHPVGDAEEQAERIGAYLMPSLRAR